MGERISLWLRKFDTLSDQPQKFPYLKHQLRGETTLIRTVFACLTIVSLFYSAALSGQDRVSYTLGDSLSGFAVCPMVEKESDKVFDGEFMFDSTEPFEDRKGDFKAITFKGFYNKGVKDGNWSFSYRVLSPVGDFEINDYRFGQAANGTDYRIRGRFVKGKAQGKWNAHHLKIIGSEANDTSLVVQGEFNEGVPSGVFTGLLDGVMIKGQFTKTGLVDGTWTFKNQNDNYTEYREFDEGVLVKHYFRDQKQSIDSVRYVGLDSTPRDEEEWREIDATGMFFDVMRYTNSNLLSETPAKVKVFERTELSNQIMRKALYTLKGSEAGGIWSCLPGSDPLKPSRVKLRYFEYSKEDKGFLSEGLSLFDEILERCDRFFDDAVVDIGRYSFEDVAYYHEVFSIYKKEASRLGSMIEEFAGPAFEYIDRDALFPSMTPELAFPDEISYEFKDSIRSREFRFPREVDRVNGLIILLHDYLKVINEDLEKMQSDVDRILEQYKKETELAENEKEMVELRDKVIARYNMEEDTEDYNSFHADIAQAVTNEVKSALKRYGEKDLETRSQEIGSLIECYKNYLALYDALKKVPLRLERVEEAYTRTLWNPYTYTYMDERVKERVYRAYEQVVLPAVLEDLKSNLNCSTVQYKPQNFVELYNRMLEIRDQDTKQVERQLRRTNDFGEIVELLELNLNLN